MFCLDDNNVDVLKIMREHNKELLKRGDKRNKDILLTTDDFELTGLHHACMRGNIQVIVYRYIYKVLQSDNFLI